MRQLHFFVTRHSFSTPDGFSFAGCSDEELKRSITVKKFFALRFDIFKKKA